MRMLSMKGYAEVQVSVVGVVVKGKHGSLGNKLRYESETVNDRSERSIRSDRLLAVYHGLP